MDNVSRPGTRIENSDEYQPQWSTWARRLAIVSLLIALVYALTLLAPVMSLLSMTFLMSLIMVVPCRLLTRRLHLPYNLAVILCFGAVILVLVIVCVLLVPATIDAANNLSRDVQQGYSQLQAMLQHYTPDQGVVKILGIKVDLGFVIAPLRNLALGTDPNTTQQALFTFPSDLSQGVGTVTGLMASAVSGITSLLSTSLLALFLSLLFLLDLPTLERALPDWIEPAYLRESSLLIQQIGFVWQSFLRGQALIAFIIALLTWFQLTVMGVQNALVVAVFCGIISLIPTIGGVIALVPIAATSFFQGSSVFTEMSAGTFALLVVTVNLILSQLVWNIVAPKILGDAVNLPLPIIIVGIFIGTALGGIPGAFLITPLIGTIRVIVVYLLRKIRRQDPFPGQEPSAIFGTDLPKDIQSSKGSRARIPLTEPTNV